MSIFSFKGKKWNFFLKIKNCKIRKKKEFSFVYAGKKSSHQHFEKEREK